MLYGSPLHTLEIPKKMKSSSIVINTVIVTAGTFEP
jgi:hypothetical protein